MPSSETPREPVNRERSALGSDFTNQLPHAGWGKQRRNQMRRTSAHLKRCHSGDSALPKPCEPLLPGSSRSVVAFLRTHKQTGKATGRRHFNFDAMPLAIISKLLGLVTN